MSGIASPWGDTPLMVAGINNPMELGGRHLTGQLSLTSTPVSLDNSPLILANKRYYTAFGKVKRNPISQINAIIKYLKSI